MARTRQEYSRTYYLRHRERLLEYAKRYRREHYVSRKTMTEEERKAEREADRVYRMANIEKVRERALAYYYKVVKPRREAEMARRKGMK